MTEDELQEQIMKPETRAVAFTEAVQMYQEKLYWLIRRIVRQHDDADDVLQETFLKAWQNLGSFRGEAKFYTWIYRIALFEAINYNKKKKRITDNEYAVSEDTSYLLESAVADTYFDGDKGELILQQALETLPPKQRQVFEMRYFDEMPYREMAAITDTSEGALKASYHHAVKKIQQYVSNLD
ncbi:RNA polymerase sigma factor [Porphyromonas uenonis]|uniref:RNA polymerase sigma factor n=1 Tax=Porphyromonas uenonis TaxID=281920 RepID=UPI0026716495|nr:sigma-70 family RNA polymerase sigma factor [Porphyromonas uenonis]